MTDPEPDLSISPGVFFCDQNPHPDEIPCDRCRPQTSYPYEPDEIVRNDGLEYAWKRGVNLDSGPPPPPPLDEAEVIARHVAPLNPWAGVIMAELDRVREENAELRNWQDAQRRQNKALVAHISGGMELWEVAEVLRDEQ